MGTKFSPTNDVNKIILFNVEDRKHNWDKFYSWLDVNLDTPIEIKLLVLDNCLFSSILYGFEVFGRLQDTLWQKRPGRCRFTHAHENTEVFCGLQKKQMKQNDEDAIKSKAVKKPEVD